jgi:hypothetical protein
MSGQPAGLSSDLGRPLSDHARNVFLQLSLANIVPHPAFKIGRFTALSIQAHCNLQQAAPLFVQIAGWSGLL